MAATTTEYGKPMILYSDKASVFRVNNKHATTGLGDTQFARAMRCLNITPLCAETSQAKGRVERAHLTLQDRLVKELRLKGICTIEAANAFAEEYMADYNRRFAKEPLHDFNAYRPLALDDDLDAEFTWREPRRVSKNLTVQYDKMLYLIEDNEYSRRAIGKYIDVWHYPDGHKELRLNGVLLPYSTYDRLSEVEPVAIVDNARIIVVSRTVIGTDAVIKPVIQRPAVNISAGLIRIVLIPGRVQSCAVTADAPIRFITHMITLSITVLIGIACHDAEMPAILRVATPLRQIAA